MKAVYSVQWHNTVGHRTWKTFSSCLQRFCFSNPEQRQERRQVKNRN